MISDGWDRLFLAHYIIAFIHNNRITSKAEIRDPESRLCQRPSSSSQLGRG